MPVVARSNASPRALVTDTNAPVPRAKMPIAEATAATAAMTAQDAAIA